MATGRRAIGWMRRLIRHAPFEIAVLLVAIVYVALHLSPSSYAVALGQLGEDTSPLLGSPRPIRSDEWEVSTPLFQAAVNNDFRPTNETSFYGETLKSFIGLPLRDWGLVFKPLVLPFFIVPAALAYSFYWASLAALMLIGWSLLLRALGFSRPVAALTSLILYFSPFVQAWSGPSPQLALFPWIVLAIVRIEAPHRLALALSLLVPVWLLSTLYAPGLPPLLVLALGLCLAFKPEALRPRRLLAIAAGTATGAAIAFAYFSPVLRAFAESEYPGRRWATGGELSLWQVASQALPGTTTEGYTNLIAENVSEAATVASWLPLLALCVVDLRALRDLDRPSLLRHVRTLGVLLGLWGLLTAWQLLPLAPLSYLLGLGFSPEARTLFASGALLLLAAGYAVDKLPTRVTPLRLTIFSVGVGLAWLLASVDLQATSELVARDELLVVPLALLLAGLAALIGPDQRGLRVGVLLVALVPTMLLWGLYNPLQSTRAMFRKPDTKITRELDALAATRRDGAIAVSGAPGAILNGVGYRSVTHVIATPSPELFRRYFPQLEESTFDAIFNRYAHFSLTTQPAPFVAGEDAVRLPIQTMARYAATR